MKLRKSDRQNVSRRDFARTLAALAATPLLPRISSASAGSDVSTRGSTIDAGLQARPQEKISPEAETLAEIVRIRYGKDLSSEQLEAVKGSLNNRLQASARLKQIKLENGDEPAFVFSASVE